MANEIKGGGNHELSSDINVITAEINAYQRVAGEAIFEIGRRLKHVKENDLAHGEFGKWLEDVGINDRVARMMMKVTELDSKRSTYSEMGLNTLYQIATLPPAEREAEHVTSKGETKKPEDMTVRELRELKKALKRAEQERERLEEENEQLAEKADKPPFIKEVYPDDYESIRLENAKYKRKYGDGSVRTIGVSEREEMYRDFANELDAIRIKFGAIATEGISVNSYAEKEPEYAMKVNKFNEFWKQYVKSVIEEQTIIEMESV